MSDTVEFRGVGPFPLPVAQRSTAHALNAKVELRIRVAINGAQSMMILPMTPDVAREMAAELYDAAAKAAE